MAQDADWRFLREEEERTEAFDTLRYIPLDEGGDIFVSIGLNARLITEYFDNEQWGDNPGGDLSIHTRLNASLAVQLGDRARIYAAVKHGSVSSRNFPTPPVEEDDFDLHAAFAELSVGDLVGLGRSDVLLRVGRQELHYGDGRVVSIREGPNVRNDFDGALVRVRTGRRITDLLAVYATEAERGAFDNGTNEDESLIGAYSSGPLYGRANLDLYAFRQERAVAPTIEGLGRDRRWTIGARIHSPPVPDGLRWDIEAAFQTGQFRTATEALDIEAYSIAGNVSYTFGESAWKLQPGMRFGFTSGDGEQGDGDLGTYKPPYPPGKYFGEASPLGPGNLMGGWAYLDFSPSPVLSGELRAIGLWRMSKADGVYAPPGFPLRGNTGPARFVGAELGGTLSWNLGNGVTARLIGGHFIAGGFIADNPSADDISYVEAGFALRF